MIKTIKKINLSWKLLLILSSVFLGSWYGIYQYECYRLNQEIEHTTQESIAQYSAYQQNQLGETELIPEGIQQYMKYIYMRAQFYQAFSIALILTMSLWIIILFNNRFKYLNSERIDSLHSSKVGDLRKLAYYDNLTNLPNRKYFLLRLRAALYRAQQHHSFFSLCFIDCDYFKQINDQYGHHIGDLLLQHIGISVAEKIRENDFLARFGGDEFCLILSGCVTKHAIKIAIQKILNAVMVPTEINNQLILPSISIGVVSYQGELVTAENLLIQADKAMYYAKQSGRGSYYWIQSYTSSDFND